MQFGANHVCVILSHLRDMYSYHTDVIVSHLCDSIPFCVFLCLKLASNEVSHLRDM